MATTTTINRRTDLIDTQSVSYIRQMDVRVFGKECKPNTRLYPYFDGIRVDEYVRLITGLSGDPLITDTDGNLNATFSIPGFKFPTGEKTFSLSESNVYQPLETILPGTGTGCRALFTTSGVKKVFRNTVDTTNTTTVENVVRVEVTDSSLAPVYKDPVAQSFNTFGVTGGCFVTGIDLYFNTKDATLPVSVEIRDMVNGYPSPTLSSRQAFVSVRASDVNTSVNASLPTRFSFPSMVYLAEDKEYCFVVMTNSKLYNMFTSVLGEKSLEDGNAVFDQPYLGSVFKSQNNYTWTAAQYEDIKFELFIADFNISSSAIIPMAGSAQALNIPSDNLSTVSGSNVITASLTYKHGLEVGSYVQIGVNPAGLYNGISGANMTGALDGIWPVSVVYDAYQFSFVIGANASVTGKITNGGKLQTINMNVGGSGYSSTTLPTVNIAGGGGTGASATAVVRDGAVVQVLVTAGGSGYISEPTITFTAAIGTGAIAIASLGMRFAIVTNRLAHMINPGFPSLTPPGTKLTATLSNTVGNFSGGNLTTYSAGKNIQLDLNVRSDLDNNVLVTSMTNELYKMSGNRSTIVTLELSSNNKNVSPIIDLSNCKSMFYNNNVNNQGTDLVAALAGSGSVDTIGIVTGGAGYTAIPTITITPAVGDSGAGGAATATITGGVVTAITITSVGTGYLQTPTITFTGGTPNTTAVATVVLTKFNTEISPTNGRSFARYITKPNTIQTISRGVRVLVTAYSSENTSIDFYIRTSLSSENTVHTDQNWTRLNCDVPRNRSKNKNEMYEYTFYAPSLQPFDVYDLKFVMNTAVPYDVPTIHNYRAIIIV